MDLFKKLLGNKDRPKPAPERLAQRAKQKYEPGDVVCGDYAVKLLLGRGGMGEVYLVEHSESGELRAAKVMRPRAIATEAELVGFRQEALSLLNVGAHWFIVRLYDVRADGRDTVLFMEYVAPVSRCTTIQDYIVRTQDYNDHRIGMWAVQFCVGMEHALKCGLAAHRDIKPGNLLVDSGAFLKIADFGLALAVSHYPGLIDDVPRGRSQLQRLQSANGYLTCGTPGYIAPELFAGGRASAQSDMFSFGMTLWQLSARSMTSPYGVDYSGEVQGYQDAILRAANARSVVRIDSPFFEVICRCLSPDPADRYPDFPTLREAIKTAAKAAKINAIDFIIAPGFRGSLEEYINRGRSYMALGHYNRALTIFERALANKPDSPEALLAKAEALAHTGEMITAIPVYESAHRLRPEWDAPLTGAAFAWLELDKHAQARRAIDQVLSRHANSLEAQLLLARLLTAEGKNDAALNQIDKLIKTDPDDWRFHDYRGRILSQLGRTTDAIMALDISLRLNPLALNTRVALASILTRRGDHAAAGAQFEKAVRLFQGNAEALNRIAAHMAEGGHEMKAIEVFQELAEASPDSRSTMLVNIGNARMRLGDAPAAASSYQEAIKVDPQNALAFYRLGDLLNDDGRTDQAAIYFARATELEPSNSKYHANAGTAYLQLGEYERASEHLRQSVELFPEQPPILYNLAAALLVGQDDPDAALVKLSDAVRIDSTYARAWYFKAQIESRLGRTAEAAASARRAAANRTGLSEKEAEGLRALLG
jgi:tetratricopeptide (TPR) repeat protein